MGHRKVPRSFAWAESKGGIGISQACWGEGRASSRYKGRCGGGDARQVGLGWAEAGGSASEALR